MLDLGAVGAKGLTFGAFVIGEGANELALSVGGPLSAVTMLQAILKLSLVSQLAIAPEDLTSAVGAVQGPLAAVYNLAVVAGRILTKIVLTLSFARCRGAFRASNRRHSGIVPLPSLSRCPCRGTGN